MNFMCLLLLFGFCTSVERERARIRVRDLRPYHMQEEIDGKWNEQNPNHIKTKHAKIFFLQEA